MSALAFTVATPGTKSPSITIAAFGGLLKTLLTESGNPVCSAPAVPPAMFVVSPSTCAIVVSAVFTDGSVHLILWSVSWSYFAGPAVRR